MATKVVVDFTLPGGVMVSRKVERLTPIESTDENVIANYRTFYTKKGGVKTVSKPIVFRTRKTIDAHKTLKLDIECYQSMLENPPANIKPNKWKSFSKKQRLQFHLNDLAADFGATSYTFEILED